MEDAIDNTFNSNQETVKASRVIRGKVNDISQTLPITDLSNFADGIIKFELVVTDSALNVGSEIFKDSIYKGSNENNVPVTYDLSVTVSEDTSNYEIILSATDAENNTLTYSIVDPPSFGNLDTTTLGDSRVRAYELSLIHI